MSDKLRFEVGEDSLVSTLCLLVERFVDNEYEWLDTVDRVVIDVGANVGDSILYFASRGAVHVYGYEPDRITYEAAVRNIDLNGMDNATVVCAAVVGAIGSSGGQSGAVSFAEVIDRARSRHPGVAISCKIDCEGCEFDIFRAENLDANSVVNLSQILMEYHGDRPDRIRRTLEMLGFQVEVGPGAPGVGWLRAKR
jgi:MinD-like ATPase involved in chromosome partitioning or flagellar assembly